VHQVVEHLRSVNLSFPAMTHPPTTAPADQAANRRKHLLE